MFNKHREHEVTRFLKITPIFLISIVVVEPALARGGSHRNGYGYQRRLQESRGFVTTYSNGYAERGPLYYYRHRNRR